MVTLLITILKIFALGIVVLALIMLFTSVAIDIYAMFKKHNSVTQAYRNGNYKPAFEFSGTFKKIK